MAHLPEWTAFDHSWVEETQRMRLFYGGKKCLISGLSMARWAHMLYVDLHASHTRLQWMVNRHLRQDRLGHSRCPADVRENIVPMSPDLWYATTCTLPPTATLFLHEDVVARTLAFERDLERWRSTEIKAGRGDPGRPNYEDVFPVSGITEHRWHCAVGADDFMDESGVLHQPEDCPGIDPPSENPLPVIPTLLSIPFSLLHTLPRLASMVPLSQYRRDLISMGEEIVLIWPRDPPTMEPHQSTIHAAKDDITTERAPLPTPIDSRSDTFEAMRLRTTISSGASCHFSDNGDSIQDKAIFQLTSSDSPVGIGGELYSSTQGGEQPDIASGATEWAGQSSSPVSVESSNRSSEWSVADVEDAVCGDRYWSPSEVAAWLSIVDVGGERLPGEVLDLPEIDLTPTPFEGGVHGMTVNEFLMIHGLIEP